jgi:Flp pilus assembly protein TadD
MTIVPSLSLPAVSALQLLLNWTTSLLLYPITMHLAGRKAALTASCLGLFFAPAIFFALKILAVTLGLLLLTAGVLVLLGGKGWKAITTAGLLFGLAALTTPSALPTAAAAALLLVIRSEGGRRFFAPAIFLLCFLLTILPATLSNYLQDGSRVLISSNHGVNFHIGNNPGAVGLGSLVEGISADAVGQETTSIALARRETGRLLNKGEVAHHFFRKGLFFIAENPGTYLQLLLRKAVLLLSGVDFPNEFSLVRERRDFIPLLWCFPLAGTAILLLSAVALSRREVVARLWWFLLLPLSQSAVSLIYFNANRHVLAFQFLAIPAAAVGLALGRKGLKVLPAGIAAGIIAASFVYAGREARAPYNEVFYRTSVMVAYNDAGKYGDSIAAYEEATRELSPSRAMVQVAVEAYAGAGDIPGATEVFSRAFELYPGDRELTLAAARFLGSHGRGPEALVLCREWLRENPDDWDARVQIGQTLVAMGRDSESEQEIRKVLAEDPLSADAHYLQGVLFLRRNETEAGIGQLEEALKISPRLSGEAYFFLAMAYLKVGKPEKARENLDRAEFMGYPVPEESRERVFAPIRENAGRRQGGEP